MTPRLAPLLARVPTRALTGPFATALWPRATAFARALEDPRKAQERALARLRTCVPALERVRSLDDLRALPVRRYDDLMEDIERVAAGERARLSRSPLVRFERSGGSSGARKLIPMTKASLDEMNRALQPWLWSLYGTFAGVAGVAGVADGPAYWSISPLGLERQTTSAGIPIGSDDDAAYFPSALRALLSRVLAAPSALGQFTDVERCRYATLRVLLEREDLALLSVWSPTFLTLLWDALDRHLDRLLDDLARGTCSVDGDHDVVRQLPLRALPARAASLRAQAARAPLTSHDLWPRLALLSMWTDGAASSFVADARKRCPGVPVQGKGLLATEGVVSIPWPDAPAPVLAVRSHVLEFLDDKERAWHVHELEEGKSYDVVLTTGAGLVRYRLGDRIEVVGRAAATPCVRFVGRADSVSDLVGEKLAATFVGSLLEQLRTADTRFLMLAPSRRSSLRYRLYADDPRNDAELRVLGARLEEKLADSHPYRYARALGQLAPLEVVRVDDGTRRYEAGCIRRGARAGDIKPTPLSLRDDWDDVFEGRALEVN